MNNSPTAPNHHVTMKELMTRPSVNPGHVKVQNPALFNSLFLSDDPESEEHLQKTKTSQKSVRSEYLKLERTKRLDKIKDDEIRQRNARYNQHLQKSEQQLVSDKRHFAETLKKKIIMKENNYKMLTQELSDGNTLSKSIGNYLKNHEDSHKIKVKKQYDTWSNDVYNVINDKIRNEQSARTSKQTHAKHIKSYQEFLDITNSKGSIFRDIIIESEYDPLKPNRNSIKYATGDLKDPVKRSIQRRIEETGGAISSGVKGKTREVLDVELWASGKIESTPHGFFSKMMNSNGTQSKPRSARPGQKSSVNFDQYNIEVGSKVLSKEFPRGKRSKESGEIHPAPFPLDF